MRINSINEASFIAETLVKTAVEAGAPVMTDHLADVSSVILDGVVVPPRAGHFILFSVGWRKGLLYDFGRPDSESTPSDALTAKLGAAFSYLLGRSRFNITEAAWQRLLEQRWFPFIGLPTDLLRELVAYAEAAWRVDELLPRVVENTRARLATIREFAKKASALERHRQVIDQSLAAYGRSEYPLVIAALLPRIEGILRERHARVATGRATQDAMVEAVNTSGSHRYSLMLPQRLATYLQRTFFAFEDFSEPARVQNVTRHAVAHGVAGDELMSEKEATLAVLLLEQLTFLLARR